MTIRPFVLPTDFENMNALVLEGFQYPENPDWNMQEDDKVGMIDRFNGIKKMWPVMRVMQFFSPPMRDIMRGFIAEEDGRAVGLINYMKPPGNSDEWYIANVTVLPAYRRRGIARKLVEATIATLRERHAHLALLGVIDGNLPAFNLYKELGFEAYSGATLYDVPAEMKITPPALTDGWSVAPLLDSQWRIRYDLARRITPANVQRYEPIREKKYKMPFLIRTVGRLFDSVGGSKNARLILRTPNGEVAGLAFYSARIKPGGVNHAGFLFDSNFGEAALPFAQYVLAHVQALSPGRRIEIEFDNWETAMMNAMEGLGCNKRFASHNMGLDFTKN